MLLFQKVTGKGRKLLAEKKNFFVPFFIFPFWKLWCTLWPMKRKLIKIKIVNLHQICWRSFLLRVLIKISAEPKFPLHSLLYHFASVLSFFCCLQIKLESSGDGMMVQSELPSKLFNKLAPKRVGVYLVKFLVNFQFIKTFSIVCVFFFYILLCFHSDNLFRALFVGGLH